MSKQKKSKRNQLLLGSQTLKRRLTIQLLPSVIF